MLYASTRNSVTKSLGSTHFTDSIFATSKKDVTGDAYTRHLRSLAAPKPLSKREKELAEMFEAEKKAADDYQGSNALKSLLSGAAVGFTWSPEVEEAFKQLAAEASSKLLVVVSNMLHWVNWSIDTLIRPLKHRAKPSSLSRSQKPPPIR
jgi:twinfilin-like protein